MNSQIEEWAENPTTEALKALVEAELEALEQTNIPLVLVPGDPQKTQENLTNLEARWVVWDLVRDVLSGDWSYFETDEED